MISFIVPIYNAEPYLEACIKSLLHQTERDIQIILVDDGSTDKSLSIARACAQQDERIEIYTQTHAGQSIARNLGLQHATGDYIAFVDADDTIEPDWCAQHMAVIGGFDYVQSQAPCNRYQYTVVWGRLYRRQAIEGLLFEEGLIYEDVLFSVDLWLRGASCRLSKYRGYHYHVNPTSTTARPHPEAQQRVFMELRKRIPNASLRGKFILLYTLIRLRFHFIRL